MPTQALILAAGRGSRLGPKTEGIPKPLLQVGPKRIVEHQLEMLAKGGIGPVGMVLGYQADEIIEIVGAQAEYLHNARWATSNSLYSFYMAREWIKHDFVLLNCDIVMHPKILDKLYENGPDSFAYDSSSGGGMEHMKVHLKDGRLIKMSKVMPEPEIHGENVGMLYFSKASADRLFEICGQLIEKGGHMTDWIGTAVQILAKETPLNGVDIAGYEWAEVDFAYDLVKARKKVWPAIKEKTSLKKQLLRYLPMAAIAALLLLTLVNMLKPTPAPLPVRDWDTISLQGLNSARIGNQEKTQKWYILPTDDSLHLQINGPDSLRIEARQLINGQESKVEPQLLHIYLNDKKHDYLTTSQELSKSIRFDNKKLSKRKRTHIYIPPGKHALSLFPDNKLANQSLIRLRHISQELDE